MVDTEESRKFDFRFLVSIASIAISGLCFVSYSSIQLNKVDNNERQARIISEDCKQRSKDLLIKHEKEVKDLRDSIAQTKEQVYHLKALWMKGNN